MVEFAVKNAWLVALLPLMSATIIALFTKKYPLLSSRISRLFILVALSMALCIGYQSIVDIDYVIQNSSGALRWFTSGDVNFYLSWKVDAVTAMMLVVVTLISSLVQLYSREYMDEYMNKGFARYFAELSLFSFSMLVLILTDNFLVLYAGWELVGVSSFLLIGFFYEKKSAAFAAKKAFLTNRVGDFGFLLGILLVFTYTGTLNFDVAAAQIAAGKMEGFTLTLAAILLFFGAIGKSGQFPLHVWLPDAMEGPTPVSALIHAATMVAAGVYMVAKIMPIFSQSVVPIFGGVNALTFVAWIGGITAIMAAFIAVTQNDIKKILAYSTVSQLGFMILALGMFTTENGIHPVGYTAGVFHLFTHAFFKAMLFLCSGSVIHACHTQDVREMGGLHKYMPVTSITCLIGTAAISGFPLTAGFWSKDEILAAAFEANMPLFIIAAVAAVFTAFYMFRLYFMTFTGEYRGHGHPHEPGWRMKFPLVFLAVPSLLVGFLGTPFHGEFMGIHIKNWFHDFVHFTPVVSHGAAHGAAHGPNWMLMGLSVLIFATGCGLAASLYYNKSKFDKAESLANSMKPLYNASLNKLYFDEAYQWLVDKVVLVVAKISHLFDKFGIDMIVNGVSMISVGIGHLAKYLHSGKVQQYVIAIVVSLLLFVFGFTNSQLLGNVFSAQNTLWIVLGSILALVLGVGMYIKKRVFD